jgi:hypothetical protein
MKPTDNATFWLATEKSLGANTTKIFADQAVEARLVNDSRSLKIILHAKRNDKISVGDIDFDWYTLVTSGALMTAAEFVLHRPGNRPELKISRSEFGNMVATLTDPNPAPEIESIAFDPATLEMLVHRIAGTLNRATG